MANNDSDTKVLTKFERQDLEDLISDLQFTAYTLVAERDRGNHTETYMKELNEMVSECETMLTELQPKLKDDEKRDIYKIHLFVPFHINNILNNRKYEEEKPE